MKQAFDTIIIGGGAAGLAAAIAAAERAPHRIAILEKESRVGKKLAVTGNGRCNLSNRSGLDGRYTGDTAFAQTTFGAFGVEGTLVWLQEHGIDPVELEDGKLYPRSLQAGSVVDQLRFAAAEAGVCILNDCTVLSMTKEKTYQIHTNSGDFTARQVLIATGGKAGIRRCEGTTGYDLLEQFGHKTTKLTPSIVQIITEKEPIKPLAGIKVDGVITACAGREERTESGEILFTEYGLSGPPVLQVSGLIARHGQGEAVLDLLPTLSFWQIKEEIARRCQRFSSRTCEELLTGFMHKRLGGTVIKRAGVEKLSLLCGRLTAKEQAAIAGMIKKFPLACTGTKGWSAAQVTGGGVKTEDFDPLTMESKKSKGLFAAGEVLNVTGDCGGFNLQWAWTSGILAGRAMAGGQS